MDFNSLLKPMQKSSIKITYDKKFTGKSPIGTSKVGGKPDLPTDFKWFNFIGAPFSGTEFQGEVKSRPLSFLAQVNCKEASRYDRDKLLPITGMLYFFYEISTWTVGETDLEGNNSALVYYYPGSISELQETNFPIDLSEEYQIPEMPMTFTVENNLPDFEEFIEWHDYGNFSHQQQWARWWKKRSDGSSLFDEFNEARKKITPHYSQEEDQNKLLGYANIIQNGMLLECEEIAGNVCSERPIPESQYRKLKEQYTKWQLLFQLDSIQTPNYEMFWGDGGILYYYIKIDDLLNRNFNKSVFMFRC